MKRKFAFFDFDDTLLPKDSMGRLVIYCIKRHPWTVIYLLAMIFKGILYGLKMIDFIPLKEKIIFPLKILSEEELKDFYDTCLIPHYYSNVVIELRQKKAEGYLIYLVSASPEAYLKYTDLPVDCIIGTVTKVEDGKNTTTILGENCKGEEKVKRINEVLSKQHLEIDYEQSFGYSDSLTDLPMLRLTKNRIRINKKDGSMSQFE